jgi:hypothetical protein
MHESPVRRAAPQHPEVDVNGSNGPFATFMHQGRNSTYCALMLVRGRLRSARTGMGKISFVPHDVKVGELISRTDACTRFLFFSQSVEDAARACRCH